MKYMIYSFDPMRAFLRSQNKIWFYFQNIILIQKLEWLERSGLERKHLAKLCRDLSGHPEFYFPVSACGSPQLHTVEFRNRQKQVTASRLFKLESMFIGRSRELWSWRILRIARYLTILYQLQYIEYHLGKLKRVKNNGE